MISELTNKLILTIIVASLFAQISAYGEPLKATIWIPEKLLLNQQYYGIIVVDQELESDVTFDVITDNDEVTQILTENVVIPKTKHHGIIT
ncbi:MAG: hypothetical protein ACK4TO_03140, partial [Candidatus Nitrosotenuis sp.]